MTKLPPNELIDQPSEAIVAFYLSQRPDTLGRRIEEIWSWDYQKLEYTHDFIFPPAGDPRYSGER